MSDSDHKERVLYIAPSRSTFINNDIKVLSKHFRVIVSIYNWTNKLLVPIVLLRQFLFLLLTIWKYKVIIISFGGYWSFLPSLMGRLTGCSVYVILNGTDCASLPEFNYGNLRLFPLKYFIKYTYKLASVLLPVSSSLISTYNSYTSNLKNRKQGYKEFFPDIKTPCRVIGNGVDEHFWKKDVGVVQHRNRFVSVFTESQYFLKGGPLIVSAAKKFPEITFIVVGMSKDDDEDIPENLQFVGRRTPEELKEIYSESQFYMQLSNFEGFGVSLCEAMLCGCIPVVSSVNILPEIVKNTGYVLESDKIGELEQVINNVLIMNDLENDSENSRKQIVENYTLLKREKEIVEIIRNKFL